MGKRRAVYTRVTCPECLEQLPSDYYHKDYGSRCGFCGVRLVAGSGNGHGVLIAVDDAHYRMPQEEEKDDENKVIPRVKRLWVGDPNEGTTG